MRKLMIIVLVLGMIFASFGQEKKDAPKYGWTKEVIGNLNFTQNQFENWTAGGENTWSWQMDVKAKYNNIQEKYKWENSGKLSFGKTKLGSQDARKSADEIKLESVYTYRMGLYVNPFASFTALTQFAQGYAYPATGGKVKISNFFDPAYFTQSIGVGYQPNEMIKTRAGAALKETITDKYPVPYADDPETSEVEKTKVEYGIESVTDFNAKLSEKIKFESKLGLFSNLQSFDEIDVDWDNSFNAKVSDYISVSFNVKLFYDKDLSKQRQLKQTLAVGLTYTLL